MAHRLVRKLCPHCKVAERCSPELADRRRSEGAHLLQNDRRTVLTFPAEEPARKALASALASGAIVVSFTPHRRSLEELFVARARGKAAAS